MLFDPGRVGRQSVTKTHAMTNAGIYTTPTLDLSFPAVGGGLDPQLTFTRASTATYFDSSGTMQTAATNAPRFDYDPVTHAALGLLIEDTRLNLMLNSGNLAAASWVTVNSISVLPTVTANQATAPDGTLTAARIVYPAVSAASAYSMVYQLFATNAAPYALSIWLRGSVGGEQLYLYTEGGGPFYSAPRMTLTTQWQRYTFVSPALTAAGSWYLMLGTDLRDGAQTSTVGSTVFAWGGQVEQGTFATSYIPTTSAAVTRAIDTCVILPANMGWFVSPGGSWMAEFIPFNITGLNGRILGAIVPGGGGITTLFANPSLLLAQYDGAAAVASATSMTANAVSKGASTWAAGTGKLCLNAGAVASGAMATGFAGLATTGIGIFTVANAGLSDNGQGYIRRVRYWPRVLSDAEMQSVTT